MQALTPRQLAQTRRHGRDSARAVVFLVVALLCAGAVRGQSSAAEPDVTIGRDGEAYTVTARFDVPYPVSTVFDVLSDYEDIPRFMPDIKKSIVHERSDGRTLVEQEAVSRVLLFSKRVYLMLEVERTSDAMRFRDTSGRSFRRYDGSWQVSRQGARTVIDYRLAADPAFSVPQFLIRRLLEREAHETIDRLRAEMAARGIRKGTKASQHALESRELVPFGEGVSVFLQGTTAVIRMFTTHVLILPLLLIR
jgi:ribosome-associated toxin RatA of RatAB toxin-antitoxin module